VSAEAGCASGFPLVFRCKQLIKVRRPTAVEFPVFGCKIADLECKISLLCANVFYASTQNGGSLNVRDIRTVRIARKIPQKRLAEMAKVPLRQLSKVERGLEIPGKDFFLAVAQVLDIDADELKSAHTKLAQSVVAGEGYVTAVTELSFINERIETPSPEKYRVIDLFCGTGGFSHGFELTGRFNVTVGVDLLPDRIETFSANHPTADAICSDIYRIKTTTIAKSESSPDVIIGGPPCQGFSSIRPFRTLTEDDKRNNLFEQFALVVSAFQPRWFVLENVVGLLTHKRGQTLETMLKLFEEVGYTVEWKVLNSALYGLPQRRERLIVVGSREGKRFQWPSRTHYLGDKFRSMAGKVNGQVHQLDLFENELVPAISVMDAIGDLPAVSAGEACDSYLDERNLTHYQEAMRKDSKVLTLHEATAHTPRMLSIIRHAGHNRSDLPEGMTTSGFSSSYSRLEPDIPSVTLTVNFVHPASNKCIHPYQDRALTPREGARLQGFEDSYIFKGTRSQVVKQIGNAVPPILGRIIASSLAEQF
jgi:DNA (cytosine-5)-methyltransferase 1